MDFTAALTLVVGHSLYLSLSHTHTYALLLLLSLFLSLSHPLRDAYAPFASRFGISVSRSTTVLASTGIGDRRLDLPRLRRRKNRNFRQTELSR